MPTAHQRISDFFKRKAGNPHLISVVNQDWEYIPIHPCADETSLLTELNYQPERCVSVDFYWRYGPEVAFVQVYSQAVSPPKGPGIYARRAGNAVYLYNIVAVLHGRIVTTSDLRIVQERCILRGFSGDAFPAVEVGSALTFVGPLAENET